MTTPLVMSLFTLALLLPAMYKRHVRRAGALVPRTAEQNRKGRMAVAAVAALLVVGGMAGGAYASNGDPNGSNTGTEATNLIPVEKQSTQVDPTPQDVAAQTEKNRVAIN